jgi:hypothetical protein
MTRRAGKVALDAGASPEWASVLAAAEALGDRASASEGGVSRANTGIFLGLETWLFSKKLVGF